MLPLGIKHVQNMTRMQRKQVAAGCTSARTESLVLMRSRVMFGNGGTNPDEPGRASPCGEDG